jgi:hypothetical protein
MWRAPTTDDFRDAILEDELQAWQDVSVADGKDPTAKSISNAVGIFRTSLRSGYKGIMGIAGTLPHDLIPEAMHIAVFYFLAGRGGAKASDGRKLLYSDAKKTAERISDGRLQYSDPDDYEDEEELSPSYPKASFKKKARKLTRADQAGI